MIVRKTVLLAAAVAVALLATACAGDDAESTAPAPPAATEAAPAPPEAAPPEAPAPEPSPPAATETPAPPPDDEVELTQAGGRLAAVRDRGEIRCGVRDALPGFNFLTPDGDHVGFDSDYCRVIAAAVLGDANAVDFVDLATADRFTALQSDEIDVLVRNTTYTASRDGKEGANFVTITFYDGQGILVREDSGIRTLEDLADATICVAQGTTTELNLTDVMSARGIPFQPIIFGEATDARTGYRAGSCEAFTSDRSILAVSKNEFEEAGEGTHHVLAEIISKEPLGPAVVDGDTEWAQVVKWAVLGTIAAWELGLDSSNINSYSGSNPSILRLLGNEGFDPGLGLAPDFVVQAVSQVGNYEEIYREHLEPLGLPLDGSLNDLFSNGGMMYAPPYR